MNYKAIRPSYSVLKSAKGTPMLKFDEAIDRYFRELNFNN
jgi:hypothetical protein